MCWPVVTIIAAAGLVNWCEMTVILIISSEEIINHNLMLTRPADIPARCVRRKLCRIFICRHLPAFQEASVQNDFHSLLRVEEKSEIKHVKVS